MLNLTIEEISNLIAFGNRATMQGKEADTWYHLKVKLGAEGQRLADEMQAQQDKQAAEPGLRAVGNEKQNDDESG